FKLFNDGLGHGVGDEVLRIVSARMAECVRSPDIVGRLSGDEFAVLLEDCPQPFSACLVAERIQARMTEAIQVGGRQLHVSVSIGIAMSRRAYRTVDQLLHDADTALYRAKAAGRQRFVLFDESLHASAMNVLDLEQQMRAALEKEQFVAYFQPIVRLADGGVTGYEALIRWRHPEKGEISPAHFIPIAEETGLIGAIGDWVLEQACAEAAKWPGRIGLAVNVSPRQFQTKTLPLHVATALLAADLSPRRLELEITESVLFQGSEANLAILHDLRDLGVTIALDDFGTGYSALGYLRRFPIDRIKIDRIFVGDLSDSEESKAVVGAIVGLGRALGMRVTAEGVETKRQLDEIRAGGCNEAQGFYFSRPVAAAEIPALLARVEPGGLAGGGRIGSWSGYRSE
ncbi:MAG: bifunctional diguanylate cyclase/phosphodiesterase, partial [Bauldia sp.]|nr:bifunctional diguanylate cyclase/phosphodiesterase [Bauldia sp.]